MPSAIQNLSQIPFDSLIGGPMQAAIEAQAAAAASTIDFIERVAFLPQNPNDPNSAMSDQVRNVTFKYTKLDGADEEGEPQEVAYELSVPILTIVPIPFLRIDEMTIDFTARISEAVVKEDRSSSTTNMSSRFSTSASVGFRAGFWNANANVSYGSDSSSTRTTASSRQETASSVYTVDVHVRAVQDALPKGLSRVLDILESVITEKQGTTAAAALRR